MQKVGFYFGNTVYIEDGRVFYQKKDSYELKLIGIRCKSYYSNGYGSFVFGNGYSITTLNMITGNIKKINRKYKELIPTVDHIVTSDGNNILSIKKFNKHFKFPDDEKTIYFYLYFNPDDDDDLYEFERMYIKNGIIYFSHRSVNDEIRVQIQVIDEDRGFKFFTIHVESIYLIFDDKIIGLFPLIEEKTELQRDNTNVVGFFPLNGNEYHEEEIEIEYHYEGQSEDESENEDQDEIEIEYQDEDQDVYQHESRNEYQHESGNEYEEFLILNEDDTEEIILMEYK